jgi:predicted component of type VI protein secretion system
MPTFIGFNTQNQFKKFTLLDGELVKRDLLNAFNIRQGQLPGKPEYGTAIWDNLFENQTNETTRSIEREIQRVAGYDPRLQISSIDVFPQENGILIQLELAIVPSTDAQRLAIFFDQESRRASYV